MRDWGWKQVQHPDHVDRVVASVTRSRVSGEPWQDTFPLRRHDGTYRWFLSLALPIRAEAGEIVRWFGTNTDITELREASEQQAVMVAELQHRTRNLIGVVRSICAQTLRNSATLREFETAFNHRLAALSRVQGLLSRADDEPITIGALLRSELDALGADEVSDRITTRGPEVRLRKGTVQTFALALHELATNARKYGALGSGLID